MVYMSGLEDCPTCGTKPVMMEFIFQKNKMRREYSFICCENNPGHSMSLEEAAKSWNNYILEKKEA